MDCQPPLAVSLYGRGSWGEKIATRLRALPGLFELVEVVDSARPEAEFRAGDPEAFIVATPPSTHRSVVASLLERGARRIRVEKPLAVTVEDARWMRDAAREAGAQLYVGHTTVAAPEVATLRAILSTYAVNRVRAVRSSSRPARCDSGAMLDLGSHDVALCLSLGFQSRECTFVACYDAAHAAQIVFESSADVVVAFDQVARTITWRGGVIDASSLVDPLTASLHRFHEGADNADLAVSVVAKCIERGA